jgi:hypothetical protein
VAEELHRRSGKSDEAIAQVRAEEPAAGVAGSHVQQECVPEALPHGLGRISQLHSQRESPTCAAAAASDEEAREASNRE